MKKLARYLITTADEVTWKFDQPIIFLGEWCRLYDRRHIWKDLDGIVEKPYGLKKSEKDYDFLEVKKLELKLFPEFCEILNKHFKLSHSKRFWEIIHAHWFRDILKLLLNRINTLKQCFQFNTISGTSFYKNHNNYILSTFDYISLFRACGDDNWNNNLNKRIIELLDFNLTKEFIECQNKLDVKKFYTSEFSIKNESLEKKIFKWCLYNYNKISRKFLKDEDAFIINSYLPTLVEIQLELALKQWPQAWGFQHINFNLSKIENVTDKLLRKELIDKFTYKKKSEHDYEKIVRSLLFELFPICYLEGFDTLKEIVNQQIWPKSPKFIFTSNNYHYDEIFKLWTASKVEQGSKYYIGQHGNNYGTRRNFSPPIEEIVADKFITWGFKKTSKHFPAFIFKNSKREKKKYNSKGGLILIELPCSYRIETWDVESEYIEYFKDQQKFIKKLNNDAKNNLTIRLHHEYKKFRWSEKKRWLDFAPSLKLDNGELNIRQLISKNRLVVHSYDSTGMLETLSQNIPTLAFWQDGLDHLEDDVVPYYKILIDAGIIYFSAESVASKVNDIWDDVEGWWNQIAIQNARNQFCEFYAKESNSPVFQLKKILLL